MSQVYEGEAYSNMTATTSIANARKLLGIMVASASSTPTIKVGEGSTTIVNTFTPLAGTFYPMPCTFGKNGLTVTISGTVDCTVFWGQ